MGHKTNALPRKHEKAVHIDLPACAEGGRCSVVMTLVSSYE